MEAQDRDETKASAMTPGKDAGVIALPSTKIFSKNQFFDRAPRVEQFSRQMQGANRNSLSYCAELLNVLAVALLQQEIPQ